MTTATKLKKVALLVTCCGVVLPAGSRALPAGAPQEDRHAAVLGRAQSAQQAGDYKTAEQLYLGILHDEPDLLAAQFGLGATYYEERKSEQSNDYLLKVVATQPGLFPAQLLVGSNYLRLGDPARAVPFLRRAVQLKPDDEYANHNLATSEYLSGDYKGACADYVRYLRMPGKGADANSWYGLGEVSVLLGREASIELASSPPTDPYRLRFLASEYRRQSRWVLAASRLRMLIDQPAWRDWGRMQLGEVYLRQNKPAQAVAQFQQVLAANAESAEAHFGLGMGLLMDGKTPAATPELVIAARRNPWLFSHPESFIQIESVHFTAPSATSGQALVDAYISELARSTAGADTAPSSSFVAALSSACHARHEENEKKVATALRPGASAKARLDLAANLLDEGDVTAAADLLRKIAPSPPADRDARSILEARITAAQGEPVGATQAMLPLLGRKQNPETAWWVSTVMEEVGRLAMEEVWKISPDSTFAHLLRAEIENAHNNSAAAISEYQLAVQSAPTDPMTHFKLGDALWQAGRFEEAITALQDALKLDPHNAAAYYQLGDSYLSISDPQKAIPFLTEASRLNPGLNATYKDLGRIYYDQGHYQDSLQLLKKVADADADGSVHYLLFRNYSRLGNREEAATCLKRFQELKKQHEDRELFYVEVARQQEQTFDESTPGGSHPAAGQSNPKRPN